MGVSFKMNRGITIHAVFPNVKTDSHSGLYCQPYCCDKSREVSCPGKCVLQLLDCCHAPSCCRFSDSYIVRVKAVVMTRDDSSGGWFPQEGGGISRVGVCKVMHPEGNGRSGFLIHGERQTDKLVMTDPHRGR